MEYTEAELRRLAQSIPGEVAIYLTRGTDLQTYYYSDGIPALSGMDKEEYERVIKKMPCRWSLNTTVLFYFKKLNRIWCRVTMWI